MKGVKGMKERFLKNEKVTLKTQICCKSIEKIECKCRNKNQKKRKNEKVKNSKFETK